MFTVGKKPEQGIYVGRPSPLGNPFYMSNESMRDFVCNKYEDWFKNKIAEQDPVVMAELQKIASIGKDKPMKLICYCAPKRCHADTIADYLNNQK